jgi:hypothetical protein
LVLLIPVVLWALSNPVLAGGVLVLVAGAYVLTRVSVRILRARPRESGRFVVSERRSTLERDHNP